MTYVYLFFLLFMFKILLLNTFENVLG